MKSNKASLCFIFYTHNGFQASFILVSIKKAHLLVGFSFLSDLDKIQTCNLLSRNQVRYSVAPRGLVDVLKLRSLQANTGFSLYLSRLNSKGLHQPEQLL